MLVEMQNASGGGAVTHKTSIQTSFTIAIGATKTITISDMQGIDFLYGVVTWSNTFPFLYSPTVGDKTYRNNAWETSQASFLHVTVNGNQISIYNGAAGAGTVVELVIQYY